MFPQNCEQTEFRRKKRRKSLKSSSEENVQQEIFELYHKKFKDDHKPSDKFTDESDVNFYEAYEVKN